MTQAALGQDAHRSEGTGWLVDEFGRAGIGFTASEPGFEERHRQAIQELFACIKPVAGERAILHEGGIYMGCWLESTGTINAELLSRFIPEVAEATFLAFARNQRPDGLLPYKLTPDGPAFSQIQLVTPPARSAWTHYRLNGADNDFLRTMYDALARYDGWLASHRDTRSTGAVEAFCAYDTGHDLSARFWHIPDSPAGNDPARYDTDNPLLPFIAPDLTATVVCQRRYLARMAEALGEDRAPWLEKAEASERALFAQCFDAEDGFFYDRDRHDRFVRVQSDVLLRVLACEIGDDAMFEAALSRYLLNTTKFFAKYPLTSIALDDPRFDPAFDYNSWCGPTNLLTLIRTAHAFEHHHRHVELTWILQPALSALFRGTRFAQTIHAFTGREGFTECYSPAILGLLDFVERLCGILPRPDGTLWFTGLAPKQIDHRDANHETTYSRLVDGRRFTLANAKGTMSVTREGKPLFTAPMGVRIITDRTGGISGLIGMRLEPVVGEISTAQGTLAFGAGPNEHLQLKNGKLVTLRKPGYTPPTH